MYPSVAKNLKQQGWTIDVLYDPTDYLKEVEEKRIEMQEMTIQQRKEAAEKAKAAEKEALKAEILAELKAGGLLKEPTTKGAEK